MDSPYNHGSRTGFFTSPIRTTGTPRALEPLPNSSRPKLSSQTVRPGRLSASLDEVRVPSSRSTSRPASSLSSNDDRSNITFRPHHSMDKFLYGERGQQSQRLGRYGDNRARKQAFGRRTNRSQSPSFQLMEFLGNPWGGRDPDGFVRRSKDEDCMKCMLRVPHKKCENHKYIRVGGGYRHSFWYIKMLLEELEFQHLQELMRRTRLEAIAEGNLRAVKTYIRTKSGRLVERIIFLNEEDYQEFRNALANKGDAASILRRYLNKDEARGLENFDEDEQKAIKTYIRTKSGRVVERIVYISKEDYEAMKRGEKTAHDILQKHMQEGEKLESWDEAKMRTIITKVRTKSGRIIEKRIQISEQDYQRLQNGAKLDQILQKYMKLDDGQTLQSWEKPPKQAMKAVKIFTRTKSGRLVERTVLMTESEFKEFEKSGNDPNFLRRYVKLKEGETIDKWEKASTVYAASDDDEALKNTKAGDHVADKDGNIYEIVVDPITGKKYKKKIGNMDATGAVTYTTSDGRIITEKDVAKRLAQKQGKRDSNSDSEYSYRSVRSAGGTRHVRRRKKNPDGTRAASESYHSSEDEEGQKRRRARRRDRKHGPDSAYSYRSEVSAGGTRHVKRRKKRPDGTYEPSESYHSDDSELFAAAAKAIKEKKKELRRKKRQEHNSDSEHSYFSEISEGGTKRHMRRKRMRDEKGNIIGYGKKEEYDSSDTDGGKGGKGKGKAGGRKGRTYGSDSEYSYTSEVSAGGTRRRFRKQKILDKEGRVIGYGEKELYSSSEDDRPGKKGRKKKVHGSDSDYSYYSEVSEGGTRITKRKLRIRDKDGRVVGHGKEEEYISSGESEASFITVSDGKGGKIRIANPKARKGKKKKADAIFSDASTDPEELEEKLRNMTEEEKVAYLAERERRKASREQRRREKYGDKYEEMAARNEERKKAKAKSMVTYEKGAARFNDNGEVDGRLLGLDQEKKKKKKKKKKVRWGRKASKARDGHEGDNDSDYEDDGTGKRVKKTKGGRRPSSGGQSVEYIRDEKGNIIKKIKRDADGNLWEYKIGKDGKVLGKKKKGEASDDESEDDGDYFEVGPDGKIRLKPGKKRIDLSKLSKEDLRKLGIDPNLSKAEIMKLLQEKLGENVKVVFKGKKIGSKNINEYGKDVDTDELAADSDLDLDTLRGARRAKVIMKKGGQVLQDHIKRIVELSLLKDSYQPPDEKNAVVDFLAAYRLVDSTKLDIYAKAFCVEDADDMDGIINYRATRLAMSTVPSIQHITDKQMDYVLSVLNIDKDTNVSFRMFAVAVSLCDRVTKMDQYCKDLLEICNMIDIERKLALYLAMFRHNQLSDRDPNYIKVESLKIELMAGGLSWNQQDFIMRRMQPNDYFEVSFMDYLTYIPLFLSFHDNICHNPLDISNTKYMPETRRKASAQRDMNPLGYHLSKDTPFYKSKHLNDTLDDSNVANIIARKNKRRETSSLNRYRKLPEISGASYPATPQRRTNPDAAGGYESGS